MSKCKYLFIAILNLFALTGHIQAQQAFYVYQHDGSITTFFVEEVDSITVSQTGIDDIEYDNYVTQEYWTQDSVYRFSIAEIDSVGFVTPKTVLQPGVINLTDNLYPYIQSCDSLTLYLSGNTPKAIMPKIGDKLVCTEMTDVFPSAFAGEVTSIQQGSGTIIVECTLTDLTEIFKCFYSTTIQNSPGIARIRRNVPESSDINATTFKPLGSTSNTFHLWPHIVGIGYSKPSVKGGLLEIGGNGKLDITLGTDNYATYTLIVREGQPVSVNAKLTSKIKLKEEFELAGHLKWDKDFAMTVPLPATPFPFANLYVSFGAYLKAEAEISCNVALKQEFSINMVANLNSHKRLNSIPRFYFSDVDHSESVEASLKGSVGLGLYGEFGICLLDRNIAKVCLRANLYDELQGDYALYNDDIANAQKETKLYEHLKSSNISLNLVGELKITGDIIWWPGWIFDLNLLPTARIPLKTWNIVPLFEEDYQISEPNSNTVYLRTDRDKVLPVWLDMAVYDENDELVQKTNDNDPYNYDASYYYVFSNLAKDKKYKAYPIVKLFGLIEMRATPAIDIDFCPAEITKVECTDAKYITDDDLAAYPNRLYYDVTGSLEDTQDIEEWGIYYILNDGRYDLFPFEHVSSSQVQSMFHWNNGSTINIDYSSFVVERDDQAGVYVKKRKSDGQTRIVYGSLFDYTLRYDTKPSITMSNPYITGTTIIDSKVKTDSDGNEWIDYQYQTTVDHTNAVKGTYWIDYVDRGISGENWKITNNTLWYPSKDAEYQSSWTATYWDSSKSLSHSNWRIIHVRNSGQTINSNYLNWSGSGIITNVWCSSAPAYAPKLLKSSSQSNTERKNYVEELILNDVEQHTTKSAPIVKRMIPCEGGFIGIYF